MPLILQKLVAQAIIIAVGFIPVWIFLVMSSLLGPEDFWQRALVTGIGIYFLGGLQVILFAVAVFFTFVVWSEDRKVF